MTSGQIFTMITGLAAGIGFFLYGMSLMSKGLEEAAGTKMKAILNWCTKNRFVGVIVGVVFTAIIQSSGATTVMVVSFVNSGLMTLLQAVGPIMGANIGTTVTGQLISFDLGAYAPIIILFGVILYCFIKNKRVKTVGQVILGFGILFFGMSLMSDTMQADGISEVFQNVIKQLENPVFAVITGFAVTAILQSSSASTGILIAMASSGLLATDYKTCLMVVYFVLGADIGTCIVSLIASISGNKDAKRAALIHLLINIFGCVIIGLIFYFIREYAISGLFAISKGSTDAAKMARYVANFNTIHKIINIVVLFPFAKGLVKMSNLIIRGNDEETKGYALKYITFDTVNTPAAQMLELDMEIKHMGQVALLNLRESYDALINLDEDKIEEVIEREQEVDYYSAAITNYMVKLSRQGLPAQMAKNIAGYFHVVSDIERIGDHAENLADFAKSRIKEDIKFSDEGIAELTEMFETAAKTVEYSLETFTEQTDAHLSEIAELERMTDKMEKRLERHHVRRLTNNQCTPKAAIYMDIVSNLERVADHAVNIAFAIYDESQYDLDGNNEENATA